MNGTAIGGGAEVGFDHSRFYYVPDFDEFSAIDASGSAETTRTLFGIKEPGLHHVLLASVDQDKGAVFGVAVSKAQVKVLPRFQTGLAGGDVFHTYASRPSFNQNDMPFGIRLRPDEDCNVVFKPNTAGATVRVRVVRYRAYLKPGVAA